jgi:FOG: TPR repeat, SEL1 subfamily
MKFDYENMSNEEIIELVDALLAGTDEMERDPAEAAKAAKIAADRGDAKAQFSYGCFLLNGEGVEKDDAAAGDYWRRSAAQGYAQSVNRLGICALHGICGEKKDPVKAAEFFMSAADAGLPDAMFNMCMLYDSGTGVERNAEKAYSYMKMAADRKLPAACALFGMKMAFESASSQEDKEKGAEYILFAAQAGNHEGEMLYAMCCEKGIGVEKDLAEAAGWYRKAAKAGSLPANDALKRLGFPGVM